MQERGRLEAFLSETRAWTAWFGPHDLALVLQAAKGLRFLKSDGRREEPVVFLHPLFQEYFAAKALRVELEATRDYAAVLGDCPFTGEWDEVVVMLAGIYGDPIGLVKWLAAEATTQQQGRAALLALCCWETSDAVGDARAHEAVVDALIQTLGDPDERVRWEAAWTLGRIGDPRAVEPLIQALGDPDERVRLGAALALGRIGDPRAVEPLIQALGDPHGWVRLEAAVALREIGDPRAVEPLIQALGDPDEWVRLGAAVALGRIGDPRAVEPLIQALGDPDEEVRWRAAWALGKIGDPRAVEPLIQALGDPDAWVRLGAALALGRIGDPRAIEPLIQALGDPDEEVRWRAAEALGEIGDLRALPKLERMARKDTGKTLWGSVAEAAREAAERIRRRMGGREARFEHAE
jgi:HEAT repeat protein